MNITLRVKKVTVLESFGTDQIDLVLDMPTPYPKCGYGGVASIATAKGYGVKWCRDNLGVEPEIINTHAAR